MLFYNYKPESKSKKQRIIGDDPNYKNNEMSKNLKEQKGPFVITKVRVNREQRDMRGRKQQGIGKYTQQTNDKIKMWQKEKANVGNSKKKIADIKNKINAQKRRLEEKKKKNAWKSLFENQNTF